MARRKSKKFNSKKATKAVEKFYVLYLEGVESVLNKVHRDAIVYGAGYLEMLSGGEIRHIPYRKFIKPEEL